MKAEILTPKQAAIRDMRAAGLDTTVLHRTVIVEETEEFVLRSIDDGITPKSAERFLECIGNTFEMVQTSQTNVQTPYTWKDKDGKTYPITKKGACYVKRISKKTGKEYKYYLPKEIQEQIRKELGM